MMTKKLVLYAMPLLTSVAATPAFAICTTDVSGVIDGDTWTSAGSPYCVIDNITVQDLTISGAGVRVQFMGNYHFDVIGMLDAKGTAASPVLFKPDDSNTSGWQGIKLDNVPPGSRLVHVRIEGAKNSALRVLNSYPELDDIALIDSSAPQGGGLYLALTGSNQTLELTNCSVSNNTAAGHGGGIYAIVGNGALRMEDCDVQNNDATRGSTNSSNWGGGIYFEDANDVKIVNSTISDNLAYSYCVAFGGCNASGRGGGIYMSAGTLVIENTHISGNTAQAAANGTDYAWGGGIFLLSGNVTLTNSIVNDNNATSPDQNEYGGGLYNGDGRFALINSDVVYNVPEGIRNGDGLVDADNCIVWGNQGTQIVDSVGGGAVTINHCIVEGGWPDGTGNLDCDPRFKSPSDFHLAGGSCAIDAGDSTLPGLPATDKDGGPRIQGPSVDMGAYEFPGVAESAVIGLGQGADGWIDVRSATSPYGHLAWVQVNWPSYNVQNGETRPVWCDVDGDYKDEIVIGLGQGGQGWLEVKDDKDTGYAPLDWIQIPWPSYNNSNGETFSACKDLDGDGKDEIMISLGQGGQGWLEVKDDKDTGYAHLDWIQIPWPSYNSANGLSRPSLNR